MILLVSLINFLVLLLGIYEICKFYKSKLLRFIIEIIFLILEFVNLFTYALFVVDGYRNIYILFIIYPLIYLGHILFYKHQFKQLSSYSLCEGLNKIPDGLMIIRDGRVIFQNEALDSLIFKLFKTKMRNHRLLLKKLNEIKENRIDNSDDIYVKYEDRTYVFRVTKLSESYLEIDSFDVTENLNLINELEKKINDLKNIEESLLDYSHNIEMLEFEKQKTFMQNKIHNLLSYKIGVLNRNVVDKYKYDKKIYEELSNLNAEFFDSNELLLSKIAALNEDLGPLGTKVVVNGTCPFNLTTDELIYEIIREVTTNAIYHGKATIIYVDFYNDRLEIKNNGIIEKSFKKGKGLSLLEKRCNDRGFDVIFIPEDGFKIIVSFGENQ